MQGSCSDGRLCVLEVCAARDSPLTNTIRQKLHDISVAERWTSRDHDLSNTAGRRSALQHIHSVRPEHTVFSLLSLVPVHQSQMDDEATERDTLNTRAAPCFKNTCLVEVRRPLLNVHMTL